jgi:hypothetical protein
MRLISCINVIVSASKGSYTKNTVEEVDAMMKNLKTWSNATTRPNMDEVERQRRLALPIEPIKVKVDVRKFMGRWYVLGSIPTPFENGVTDSIENYEWDEKRNLISIANTYRAKGATSESVVHMHATITNAPYNSQWVFNPKILFYFPLGQ